jgi:hypothetical protein
VNARRWHYAGKVTAIPTLAEKTGALHRVWFPLRSNVGYFEAPTLSLDLHARIKQMALLAEELVFEFGMLDVTVTEHGLTSFWHPPRMLSEEDIRRRREASKKGEPVVISIAPQAGPGIPADPTHAQPLISGPLVNAYVAEYHLLLRDSGLEEVSWMKWAVPPPEVVAEAKALAHQQSSAEGIGFRTSTLPRLTENTFLDDQLKKDLNFDLALAGLMGVPAAIDDLRRPLLEHKTSAEESPQRRQRAPGAVALYALAPNFTELPWPDIIALHDDDAIGAFRAKLVEFEHEVADRPEHEWDAAIKDLGLDAAIKKANERLGKPAHIVADVAVDLAAGMLPGVSHAVTLAKGAARMQKAREERSAEWTAILIALRSLRRAMGR